MGFPENLKRLRVKMGMTQVELAKAVGVNDRTIQKYEAGDVVPKTEISIKIAEVLMVDLYDLMGKDPKINTPKEEFDKAASYIKSLFYGGDFDAEMKEELLKVINQTYYDAKYQREKKEARKKKK